MTEVAIPLLLILAVTQLALLAFLLLRPPQRGTERLEREVREELRRGREEASRSARDLRQELQGISDSGNTALARIRETLDLRVKELQEGNEAKLEAMRRTVDEKLQGTLEKRLGESFKLVGERLEAVQRGLGEMQSLAAGVGDLRRVLTNVKVRGTWAEVQLGAILEQILAPGQFERNVRPRRDSPETVEFAIRLPGPEDDPRAHVWLPIDSKFPQEDYLRLQEAAEAGDPAAVEAASVALVRKVQGEARRIQAKYLAPPETTDFAILFLATEGLYAEVVRQPRLVEDLQQQHRVVVAGPTTLAAILSSLRLGFQTLAIERQASEVWQVLAAVKTEFGKLGETLDKVRRQLQAASNTVEETGRRTRAMERKLRGVERLPEEDSRRVLGLGSEGSGTEDERAGMP